MNSCSDLVAISIALAIFPSTFSFAIFDSKPFYNTWSLLDLEHLSTFTFPKSDVQKTGQLVADYINNSSLNPEELSKYFEGDIRLPYQPNARNALTAARIRWPNGVVPYTIDGTFSYDQRNTIKWAMDEFRKKTCINFKPRFGEKDYVSIVSAQSGCWAALGRTGGRQQVNLQAPACLWKRGVVLHELMQAVGFLHEQNRPDRDEYVQINLQNIDKSKQLNFKKYSKAEANGLGLSYDYASVMHYSSTSFSKNGKPTIIAKKNTEGAKRMGQRDGFLELDVAKLRKMYKC